MRPQMTGTPDYISQLSIIVQVRADEAAQKKPNDCVLAACDLFKAAAWKQAAERTQFSVMGLPAEEE